MKRRDLIAVLGGAAIAWPLAARAQSGRVYRLGILANTPELDFDRASDMLRALRDLGYVEGRNLVVEWRYSNGRAERWAELARELVGLKVDVIFVFTTPAALAAKQATSTIPIIIPTAIDPVGAGLAASLARPGGNVTGFALLSPEISAKGLALLKEAVPSLARIAVLWNAANPANAPVWRDVETVARSTGLTLASRQVGEPRDFAAAFAAMAQNRPDGLLVLIDSLVFQYERPIVEFAVRQRLPMVSADRAFTALGGLMSYGANRTEMPRDAAGYVDRVLKGANPAELPFEQPTTFELVINLKTARAFGLSLPPLLLARADEVIE